MKRTEVTAYEGLVWGGGGGGKRLLVGAQKGDLKVLTRYVGSTWLAIYLRWYCKCRFLTHKAFTILESKVLSIVINEILSTQTDLIYKILSIALLKALHIIFTLLLFKCNPRLLIIVLRSVLLFLFCCLWS